MSFIEIPDPENENAVEEFFDNEPTLDDWLAEKRGLPVPLESHAVRIYLGPLGYMANDDDTWDVEVEMFPEMHIEVRSHRVIGGHTHYRIDCALHARGCQEPYLAWATMRRLDHLRRGIHNPIKEALATEYEERFQSTRFATLFAPKGTTAKLDAWFSTMARCINEGFINPQLLAGILRVFDAPPVGQSVYEESAFGNLLIDRRGIDPLPLDSWSSVQAELAAPDPELVIAQLVHHEVVEPTPRQQEVAPADKKLGGATKGVYHSSGGKSGISQPGRRPLQQSQLHAENVVREAATAKQLPSESAPGYADIAEEPGVDTPKFHAPLERPQASMRKVNSGSALKPVMADNSPVASPISSARKTFGSSPRQGTQEKPLDTVQTQDSSMNDASAFQLGAPASQVPTYPLPSDPVPTATHNSRFR